MASKEMSDWIKFFRTSGIPAGPALSYAALFVDNRMHINMLMELNKEYLKDIGITVMGDIIAILKYAKTAHAEFERDKPPLNISVMKGDEKVELKRHRSAGNRMLEHYMRKEGIVTESPPKVSVSPAMAVRLGAIPKPGKKTASRQAAAEIIPVKRARKVDPAEEGHYVISMPKGTTPRTKSLLQKQKKLTAKSNVFERLGKEVSGQTPPSASGSGQDVFSRLGRVQAQRDRSLSESSKTSILEYHGILKEDTPKRPVEEKILTVKIPAIFKDKLQGLQRPEVSTTSVGGKSVLRGTKGVKARLGGKGSPISTKKKKTQVNVQTVKQRVGLIGGGKQQQPKVTVTLSGMKGDQSPSRVQRRLGARAERFSPAMFGKGKIVKTTKQPVVVTLVSDKPKQKVTMKERLGSFKAEVSSTTPSFQITTKNDNARVKPGFQRKGGLGSQRGGKKSVFNRLGSS